MCGFGGRVGKQHLQNGLPAPLGQREPVVGDFSKPIQPRFGNRPAFPLRGKAGGEWVKKRKAHVQACVRFYGQGGEIHHESRFPALLRPCEPVVDESRGQRENRMSEKPPTSSQGEVRLTGIGQAEKEKADLGGLQRQRFKAQNILDGECNIPPLIGRVWSGL